MHVVDIAAVAGVFGAALTIVSASRLSASGRRRERARRVRRVRRDPSLANLGDLRLRLDEDLPGDQARYAWERVVQGRIDTATAWRWLQQYGADSLVQVLASGERPTDLHRVLQGEHAYDARQVAVLATLAEPGLFDLTG